MKYDKAVDKILEIVRRKSPLEWLLTAAAMAAVGALYAAIWLWVAHWLDGFLSGYRSWEQPYRIVLGFYHTVYICLLHYPFIVPLENLWHMQPTPYKNMNLVFRLLLCDAWLVAVFLVLALFMWMSAAWPSFRKKLRLSLMLFFLPLALLLVYGICDWLLGWMTAIEHGLWNWLFA